MSDPVQPDPDLPDPDLPDSGLPCPAVGYGGALVRGAIHGGLPGVPARRR